MAAEITEQDVHDFVQRWFHAVHTRAPLEEQRTFFALGVGIETWAGVILRLEDQVALHEQLTDESHQFHWLRVEPLPNDRVHATADLRWEATQQTSASGEKRIRADCGEDAWS
jgi:hypothetical protein